MDHPSNQIPPVSPCRQAATCPSIYPSKHPSFRSPPPTLQTYPSISLVFAIYWRYLKCCTHFFKDVLCNWPHVSLPFKDKHRNRNKISALISEVSSPYFKSRNSTCSEMRCLSIMYPPLIFLPFALEGNPEMRRKCK